MFGRKKKAQAAMEFLMTYGWAILVVLIAIGALAYFGVLNPERFLPEKCVLASGSGLFCDDHAADGTANTVTLRIKNILNEDLTIDTISLDATGETCTDLEPSAGDCSVTAGLDTIPADNTCDYTITCSTVTSGDKVKADISITYATIGGLQKTATGQLVTTAA